MSVKIESLPILEPLSNYFTVLQLSPTQEADYIDNLEPKNIDSSIFWKMYASTICYPKDSNEGAIPTNGDVAHQFLNAIIQLSKNLKGIDNSTTSGTVVAELYKLINSSIEAVKKDFTQNYSITDAKDYFDIEGDIIDILEGKILKINNKYIHQILTDIVNSDVYANLSKKSDKADDCDIYLKKIQSEIQNSDNIKKIFSIKHENFDLFQTELSFLMVAQEDLTKETIIKRYFKLVEKNIKDFIKGITKECFNIDYSTISSSDKSMETLRLLQGGNNLVIEQFKKYFTIENNDGSLFKGDYSSINPNLCRFNLKKEGNEIVLFKSLPKIYISESKSSKIYLNKTKFLEFKYNEVGNPNVNLNFQNFLSIVAKAYYLDKDDNTIIGIYNGKNLIANDIKTMTESADINVNENLDYTKLASTCINVVGNTYKLVNSDGSKTSNKPMDISSKSSTPMGTSSVSFDSEQIRNLINNWLSKEEYSYKKLFGSIYDRKNLTPDEMKTLNDDITKWSKEVNSIGDKFTSNTWVRRGNTYWKKVGEAETEYYDRNNIIEQIKETCMAVGTDSSTSDGLNKCMDALKKVTSGEIDKLLDLIKDNGFKKILETPDRLAEILPPQIALKLLKTIGFKKTAVLTDKGSIYIIEPITNWLERIKDTKEYLFKQIKPNMNDLKPLILFLVALVQKNPTLLGNKANLVLPEDKTNTKIFNIPEFKKASDKMPSFEEIRNGFKPLEKFSRGFNIINDSDILLNPFIQILSEAFDDISIVGGGKKRSKYVKGFVQVGLGFENISNELAYDIDRVKEKVNLLTDEKEKNELINFYKKLRDKNIELDINKNEILMGISILQKILVLRQLGLKLDDKIEVTTDQMDKLFKEITKKYNEKLQKYYDDYGTINFIIKQLEIDIAKERGPIVLYDVDIYKDSIM